MSDFLDPQLLAKLDGLELRARTMVEGWLSGRHRSPQKGFSVEFAEHRSYSPGDDLRYLDWKVYGKRDRYQVKQFEAESNLEAMMLLDTSESMQFRSAGAPWSKFECARTAAAALCYLVLRQNDSAGAAVFDSELQETLRPSGRGGQWAAIVRLLESSVPGPGSRRDPQVIGSRIPPFQGLLQAAERIPARSVAAVFSDALGDSDALLTGLQRLRHARHDVILFQVVDPAEEDFPFEGTTLFRGLEEAGDEAIDAGALKQVYQEEFRDFCRRLSNGCREQKCDYVKIRTDEPLDQVLMKFLSQRR